MSEPDERFEYALARLKPRPPELDRAALLFRAGQAAERCRCRRWQWSTAACASLAFGLGLLHIAQRIDRTEHIVTKIVSTQRTVPPPLVASTPPSPATPEQAPVAVLGQDSYWKTLERLLHPETNPPPAPEPPSPRTVYPRPPVAAGDWYGTPSLSALLDDRSF